jgi:membrane-bound metal-dependent hydrolase YbcI (DUF457 family)
MPNKGTHIAAGAGLGAAVLGIWEIIAQYQKIQRGEQAVIDWGGIAVSSFVGAVVGGAFGVLPDVLEPATCFEHREFFHSLAFAIIAAGGIHQLLKRIQHPMVRCIVIAAAVGYGSHLGLDARTIQGLPII